MLRLHSPFHALAALLLVLLPACTNITVVRVPNGAEGGQPGSELAPVTIKPCSALKADKRDACVETFDECTHGIGVVRADRKGRDTVVTVQCFVPNAVTVNGDEGDL